VRVRTDIAAVPRLYDYVVPGTWTHEHLAVGTRVRVPLHGRSVKGWVVADGVEPPAGVEVLPLKSWLGWGPPPAILALAEWASWRWAGPVPFFLRVASPLSIVRALPTPPPALVATKGTPGTPGAPGTPDPRNPRSLSGALLSRVSADVTEPTVLRLPPTTDVIDLVVAVSDRLASARSGPAAPGSLLVLVPSVGWAERLTERLNRRGYPATTEWPQARAGWPIVVGSRAAAWAPVPHVGAALVLDAHDPAYREQSAPTYSAVDVVIERARRESSLCLVVSSVPPVTLTTSRRQLIPPQVAERSGWAAIECVDRKGADPRSGLFSEEFVRLAHAVLDDPDGVARRGPLVCVYDRTGRARLLACAKCGELARCTNCGAAVAQVGERLRCPRCAEERPCICAACGRLKMKTLRAGVSRLREELAALLGTEVAEVSGPAKESGEPVPNSPVALGTQAVLHRVRRASAVAFLDIDLHLLAPRLDAVDESLALLVRGARLVGGRGSGPPTARLLVQTRVPDHPVLVAAMRGDPEAVLAEEATLRRDSGLPPFSALATLSGERAPDYVSALRPAAEGTGVSVSVLSDGAYLLRAQDHVRLCDLLAAVPRPPGRGLRVEVDPSSV
jgi:primosomal protein N' (replication factor Y)